MTREEAIKAMENKIPVIYTGAGSMGRPAVYLLPDGSRVNFRGAKNSIGIIKKVRRTTAGVYPGDQGMRFKIKDLYICTEEEINFAREYNKKHYPNLQFNY